MPSFNRAALIDFCEPSLACQSCVLSLRRQIPTLTWGQSLLQKRRGTITGALKYRAYKHEDDQPLSVLCSGHDAASELRDRWALLGEVMKARGL